MNKNIPIFTKESSLLMDSSSELFNSILASLVDHHVSSQHDEKTLFIIDHTNNEYTLQYFQYHSNEYEIFDAVKMRLKLEVKKQHLSSILEEARFQLVYAMKFGKTLVIKLGTSMVDFNNTFCDECCCDLVEHEKYPPYQQFSYLPRGFMLNSGQHLKQELYVNCLFRRKDKVEFHQCHEPVKCHDNFKIIMIATCNCLDNQHNKLEEYFRNGCCYGLPADKAHFRIVLFPNSNCDVVQY